MTYPGTVRDLVKSFADSCSRVLIYKRDMELALEFDGADVNRYINDMTLELMNLRVCNYMIIDPGICVPRTIVVVCERPFGW